MPHTISVRRPLVFLLAGALGCGGGDLMLPDPPGGGTVALTKFGGDAQTGTVGEPLPSPLVVQVLTERDRPASGRKVAFELTSDTEAGQVSPDTAVTNDAGQATARWVLGTAPGSHVIVARIVGGESENQVAEFTAEAKAGAPDTIGAESPTGQAGRRGSEVGSAPVVRIVDRYGNPVPDVPVSWQVTAGEGRVEQPITMTDAVGKASAQWTLGDRIGIHKVTASIGSVTGSPVTFTATVLF